MSTITMSETSNSYVNSPLYRENEEDNNFIFTSQDSYYNHAISQFDKFDLQQLPTDDEIAKYLPINYDPSISTDVSNIELDNPIASFSTDSYLHETDLFQNMPAGYSPSPIIQKDCCFSADGPSHLDDMPSFAVVKMQSPPQVNNNSEILDNPNQMQRSYVYDSSSLSNCPDLESFGNELFNHSFVSPPATTNDMFRIPESFKQDHSYSSLDSCVTEISKICPQNELLPGNIPKISLRSSKVQPTMLPMETSHSVKEENVPSSDNTKPRSSSTTLVKKYKSRKPKRSKINSHLYLPFPSYRQNETVKTIKALKSSKRVKAYELEKFDDPKLERSRRNAINAKKNRDRKEQEVIQLREESKTLKLEIEQLRIENAEVKRRFADLEIQMKAILAARKRNQSWAQHLANKGILSLETHGVQPSQGLSR